MASLGSVVPTLREGSKALSLKKSGSPKESSMSGTDHSHDAHDVLNEEQTRTPSKGNGAGCAEH